MTMGTDAVSVTRRQRAAAKRLSTRIEKTLKRPIVRQILRSEPRQVSRARILKKWVSVLGGAPNPFQVDRDEIEQRIRRCLAGIDASIELRRVMRSACH